MNMISFGRQTTVTGAAIVMVLALLLFVRTSVVRVGLAQSGSGESNANANKSTSKKPSAKKPVEKKPPPKKRATAKSKTSKSADAATGKPFRNRKGIEMVWIPPGSFDMGSNAEGADEGPVHRVTIGRGFFMGKYEVTQAQWQAVMGSNPSHFKDDENLPVEQVSWHEALQFVNRLNKMNDGYTYRLPSEAEWEYACRAGTTGDHYALDYGAIGWSSDNSGYKTHRVGSKQPNAFGLYDMSGSVWEWCQDRYHKDYRGAPADGSAWVSGVERKERVLRGGSWLSAPSFLRSASRLGSAPDRRNFNYGVRLVAVVGPQ